MGPPKFMCLSATAFVGQTCRPLWWIPPNHRSGFLVREPRLRRASSPPSKNSASGFIPFANFSPFSGVYLQQLLDTHRLGMPTMNLELYLILLGQLRSECGPRVADSVSRKGGSERCASPRLAVVCISGGKGPYSLSQHHEG